MTINVLANDSDPDGDPLSVQSVTQPVNGDVVNNGLDVTYTPDDGFSGTDTFNYTISDGALTDSATVTVEVTQSAPVAANDTASTPANTPIAIPVLANDSDGDGDTLSITANQTPTDQNGTTAEDDNGTPATGDDRILYTPPAGGFTGEDTFTYTISDGDGGSATATVTVDVTNPPRCRRRLGYHDPGGPGGRDHGAHQRSATPTAMTWPSPSPPPHRRTEMRWPIRTARSPTRPRPVITGRTASTTR